jgi:hypothetical protein
MCFFSFYSSICHALLLNYSVWIQIRIRIRIPIFFWIRIRQKVLDSFGFGFGSATLGPFWSDLYVWDRIGIQIRIMALIHESVSTSLVCVKAINTVLQKCLLLNFLVHKYTL